MLQPLEASSSGRGAHRASDGYSTLTVMATQAMRVSAPARRPPLTARTVTSPCGSSRRTTSSLTESGSGTPTVTSTSIFPPRSRTSWKRGRLECRIASDTARQAALVASRRRTSTPTPNSSTCGLGLIRPLRAISWSPPHRRRLLARAHPRGLDELLGRVVDGPPGAATRIQHVQRARIDRRLGRRRQLHLVVDGPVVVGQHQRRIVHRAELPEAPDEVGLTARELTGDGRDEALE